MALRIKPLPLPYQNVLDAYLSIDTSGLYLKGAQYILPYSHEDHSFQVTGAIPGEFLIVRVNNLPYKTVSPDTATFSLPLTLSQGVNRIEITQGDSNTDHVISVSALNYVSLLAGIAKQFSIHSQDGLDEQLSAISSPWGSRLSEFLLAYNPLLPDLKGSRLTYSRMAVDASNNLSGTSRGMSRLALGLTTTWPVYRTLSIDRETFDPARGAQLLAGGDYWAEEVNIWLPDLDTVSWYTLAASMNYSGYKELVEFYDYSMVLEDVESGGRTYHARSSDTASLFNTVTTTTPTGPFIGVKVSSSTSIQFCPWWKLDTDIRVPLLNNTYDSGLGFDSDVRATLDSSSGVDLWGSGWLRKGIGPHFDGGSFDSSDGRGNTVGSCSMATGYVKVLSEDIQFVAIDANVDITNVTETSTYTPAPPSSFIIQPD